MALTGLIRPLRWPCKVLEGLYKALTEPYKALKGPSKALEGPYRALEGLIRRVPASFLQRSIMR